MTAISWLSVYLQVECEYELLNEEFSSANVTPSHDDRCVKKRRRSISPKMFSNSEFLKTSVLTNVHRTPMFLQTFSTVVRVRNHRSPLIHSHHLHFSYLIYVHSILNILNFQRMFSLQQRFWLVNQIGLLNSSLVRRFLWKDKIIKRNLLALTDDDLYVCSEWMKPFFDVLYFGQNLLSLPLYTSRSSSAIPIDEIYSIQIHNISLDLLVNIFFFVVHLSNLFSSQENVYKKRPKFHPPISTNRPFRNLVNRLSWLPTPPTSLEKQQQEILVIEEEHLQQQIAIED